MPLFILPVNCRNDLTFPELKENLVRVNAMILTNGEYKGEFPPSVQICGYNVFYRVIDINYLYKISEQSRVPIELDFDNFEGENFVIPCLSANTGNKDYKAYIAIISGTCPPLVKIMALTRTKFSLSSGKFAKVLANSKIGDDSATSLT